MEKGNRDENLFKEEREALFAAMADISDPQYKESTLFERYTWLTERYSKLLKLTRKIFRISDSQGRILHQQQNEIQNLLDNANQGFLTFGADLKVNQQYSAECTRIFARKIAGISILELMATWENIDATEWSQAFANIFLSGTNELQGALQKLHRVVSIGGMDVQVECKLIIQAKDDTEQNVIMMILTDITERRKSEEHIKYLSYHDKLTALYNRTYIETILPELQQPEALPLSVVIIDMNGLKLVNDVFGHLQGDQCLIRMAQVMRAVCRQMDTVIRWGGDEFLILMPRTEERECVEICNKIRRACQQAEAHPIRVSVAIGAVTSVCNNTSLEELFSMAESQMYSNKLLERHEFRHNVVIEMQELLYQRCFEDRGHSERVLAMLTDFAGFLGIEADGLDLQLLTKLASLHDIGKVAISSEILGKSGTLNSLEWDMIKTHSDIGYRMAQAIGDLALAEVIVALHERWDGGGYPHGLRGERIPLLARIFSLVDVYDILTHVRPYALPFSSQIALDEIALGRGSQFDPEITERFLEYMTDKK